MTERAALKAAQQFIRNGIELGYIKMPSYPDDPAHGTLQKIEAAIAALPAPGGEELTVEELAKLFDPDAFAWPVGTFANFNHKGNRDIAMKWAEELLVNHNITRKSEERS